MDDERFKPHIPTTRTFYYLMEPTVQASKLTITERVYDTFDNSFTRSGVYLSKRFVDGEFVEWIVYSPGEELYYSYDFPDVYLESTKLHQAPFTEKSIVKIYTISYDRYSVLLTEHNNNSPDDYQEFYQKNNKGFIDVLRFERDSQKFISVIHHRPLKNSSEKLSPSLIQTYLSIMEPQLKIVENNVYTYPDAMYRTVEDCLERPWDPVDDLCPRGLTYMREAFERSYIPLPEDLLPF